MKPEKNMVDLVKDYIAYRRSLGFKFTHDSYSGELLRFGKYADRLKHRGPITTSLAVQWAKRTGNDAPIRSARKLDLIRGFAQHRALFDARTEIPARGVLGSSRYLRKTPYIYSAQEIAALQKAASAVRSKARLIPKTYATMFGLLACTGVRVSEALTLTNNDVEFGVGLLKIRGTKFQKSRLVPLHVSAVTALRAYAEFRDRFHKLGASQPFFIRDNGNPVHYHQFNKRFLELRRELHWTAQGRVRLPRIHDLRYALSLIMFLVFLPTFTSAFHLLP